MKITSSAHVDSHAALIGLIDDALVVQRSKLDLAKAELAATQEEIAVFKALPFYRRWFTLITPSDSWKRHAVYTLTENIKSLRAIRLSAEYELTIHLDRTETELLFCTHTEAERKRLNASKVLV